MKTSSLSLVAVLALIPFAGPAAAAKKKVAAKSAVVAPNASAAELEKLKGDFKWGMSPDEVLAKMIQKVEGTYEERLKKTATDPARQDRVRKEMRAEIEKVKQHSLVKFEGQKSGYDVSIIDQEFSHHTGESMLVATEDNARRFFFFANERLFKMFIAFDKDMLQGKAFKEFGGLMQARFGKAKEVTVDEKSKAGVARKLDHYVWNSKGGDVLRLVDRSSFYDVYCLVISDGGVESHQAELGKAHKKTYRSDALVDAVVGKPLNDRDENDNVIDRITGREVRRPGDTAPQEITVPSPSSTRAPSGTNRVESPSEDSKAKGKKEKPGAGLEL